jgi:P-loop Domain of unknown function (DUF2791)
MTPHLNIKRRERDAVLQSLQAGLVPKQGLHLIQVGRKAEVTALLADMDRVCEGGASFRLCVGRFGSGKSFFLNLVRNLAFQKKLVVAQADFSMQRRLYSTGGEARALYSELMRNLATRAMPEGGALPSILAGWVSQIQHEVMQAGGSTDETERRLLADLQELQAMVGGFEFAEAVRLYYRGYVEKNDAQQASALRWLRGEFETKTEARQAMGVRRIIDDESFYDSLKLMAVFLRRAGYGGLIVSLDEMVVLSHRLPSTKARQANFEALLTLLNDAFQGSVSGLGFLLAGTDECLEDKRRGLFSYEALRSRLAENALAKQRGLIDLSGPVIRLQPLTPEDLFVLLKNIALVAASGDSAKISTPDDAILGVLKRANETLGADYFRTPRDVVRSFVGLLNILEQNPGTQWQSVLGEAALFQKSAAPMSVEESLADGAAATDEADDDLAAFKL